MAVRPNTQALSEELDRLLTSGLGGDKQEGTLFHYTDAAGFHGIISKAEIWATHFRHTNDHEELEAGVRLVDEEAENVQPLLLQVDKTGRLAGFAEYFGHLHTKASLTKTANVFVASFCQKGDQLSQWRGYAARGSGFAMGFKSFPEPSPVIKPETNAALVLLRCIYDEETFRAQVRHTLTDVAKGFFRYLEEQEIPGGETARKLAGTAAVVALQRIAALVPRFKSHHFVEEQEWRLIALPMKGRDKEVVQYRPGNLGIVPYMPIALAVTDGRIDLSEVVVGPTLDAVAGVNGAKMLLNHHGYDGDTLVRPSKIPFRG